MNNLEKNISESFRRARSDIVKLQEQVLQLARTQAQLSEEISRINSKKEIRSVRIVKTPVVKSSLNILLPLKLEKSFILLNVFLQKILNQNQELSLSQKILR